MPGRQIIMNHDRRPESRLWTLQRDVIRHKQIRVENSKKLKDLSSLKHFSRGAANVQFDKRNLVLGKSGNRVQSTNIPRSLSTAAAEDNEIRECVQQNLLIQADLRLQRVTAEDWTDAPRSTLWSTHSSARWLFWAHAATILLEVRNKKRRHWDSWLLELNFQNNNLKCTFNEICPKDSLCAWTLKKSEWQDMETSAKTFGRWQALWCSLPLIGVGGSDWQLWIATWQLGVWMAVTGHCYRCCWGWKHWLSKYFRSD